MKIDVPTSPAVLFHVLDDPGILVLASGDGRADRRKKIDYLPDTVDVCIIGQIEFNANCHDFLPVGWVKVKER
jgi:hypothetical protein